MPRRSGLQVVVAALAGRAVARVGGRAERAGGCVERLVGWAERAGGSVAVAGVVVAFAACAGGESFEAGVLHKGDLTVRVGAVPSAWRPVHIDGADLAWRDDPRGGSALFDVRCSGKDDDAPLSVLTEHLIMGTTERDFTSEDTIPFDGREARHTLMRAKLDGVPMYYDIYVMKKDGCVYDLVYVAPPAEFTAGAAAFDGFARGLHGSSSAP